MKQIFAYFFVYFYLIGTLLLPMGDFSILVDLPQMYKHCKTYEDKDMTPFDFITDHLVCLDSLIDSHSNGDDQKPHHPLPNTIKPLQQPFFLTLISVIDNCSIENLEIRYGYIELKHPQRFYHPIFHPPVV